MWLVIRKKWYLPLADTIFYIRKVLVVKGFGFSVDLMTILNGVGTDIDSGIIIEITFDPAGSTVVTGYGF